MRLLFLNDKTDMKVKLKKKANSKIHTQSFAEYVFIACLFVAQLDMEQQIGSK